VDYSILDLDTAMPGPGSTGIQAAEGADQRGGGRQGNSWSHALESQPSVDKTDQWGGGSGVVMPPG